VTRLDWTHVIEGAREVMAEYENSMTVRQLFYRLVAGQILENREYHYKRLSDRLARAREEGLVAWNAIVDETRSIIGSPSIGDGEDPVRAADDLVGFVRRSELQMPRWWGQRSYVELWLEKAALVGVLQDVTLAARVVLAPFRGYSSSTFLHEAALRLEGIDRRIVVLYLGDHDGSGVDIERVARETIEDIHGVVINHFERLALTEEQIEEHDLPPQMAKRSDRRTAAFIAEHGDGVVELDALPVDILLGLVREAIARYFDEDIFRRREEELDRRQLIYREHLARAIRGLADETEGLF